MDTANDEEEEPLREGRCFLGHPYNRYFWYLMNTDGNGRGTTGITRADNSQMPCSAEGSLAVHLALCGWLKTALVEIRPGNPALRLEQRTISEYVRKTTCNIRARVSTLNRRLDLQGHTIPRLHIDFFQSLKYAQH